MSPGRAQLFNSVDYNDVATAATRERPLAPTATALRRRLRGRTGAHPRNHHLSLRLLPTSAIPAKSSSQITAETWNQSLMTRRHNSPIKIIRFLFNHKFFFASVLLSLFRVVILSVFALRFRWLCGTKVKLEAFRLKFIHSFIHSFIHRLQRE